MSKIPYESHVFICNNLRENGEGCGAKGSNDLIDELKAFSKDSKSGWVGKVRINKSGCLGVCEQGIACVIYPEGKWLLKLNSTDTEKIKSSVKVKPSRKE